MSKVSQLSLSSCDKNLGYIWIDGEWWNEIEWSGIKLCSIVWFCKKGMECDGTHSIQYHPLSQIFISLNLGYIQWNGIHKYYNDNYAPAFSISSTIVPPFFVFFSFLCSLCLISSRLSHTSYYFPILFPTCLLTTAKKLTGKLLCNNRKLCRNHCYAPHNYLQL